MRKSNPIKYIVRQDLNLSQNNIIGSKLAEFCKRYLGSPPEFIDMLAKGARCYGLGILVVCSLRLELEPKEAIARGTFRFDWTWMQSTIHDLASWDVEKKPAQKQYQNFSALLYLIQAIQAIYTVQEIPYGDIQKFLTVLRGQLIKKEYAFVGLCTPNDFVKEIKLENDSSSEIKTGSFVSISSPGTLTDLLFRKEKLVELWIEIDNILHEITIIKIDDIYYYYDANCKEGLLTFTESERNALINMIFCYKSHAQTMGVRIFECGSEVDSYPSPEVILRQLDIQTPTQAKDEYHCDSNPLTMAAFFGSSESFEHYLAKGFNPNNTSYGLTPLMAAVLGGQTVMTRRLISIVDASGYKNNIKLLLAAIECRYSSICQMLVTAGIEVEPSTQDESPLIYACRIGSVEVLDQLLAKTTTHSELALRVAVMDGHYDVVKRLLEHKPSIFIMRDRDNALHLAAENKRGAIAELLISHGADTHSKLDGKTVANRAIENKADDVLVVLLCEAVKNNDILAINFLLERGTDITAKNTAGISALELAIENNNTYVIGLLFYMKKITIDPSKDSVATEEKPPSQKLLNGYDLLSLAIKLDKHCIVDLLLKYGIDPDFRCDATNGLTALDQALMRNCSREMLIIILDSNPNINFTVNVTGRTPMDLLVTNADSMEIGKLTDQMVILLARGDRVNQETYDSNAVVNEIYKQYQTIVGETDKAKKLPEDKEYLIGSYEVRSFKAMFVLQGELCYAKDINLKDIIDGVQLALRWFERIDQLASQLTQLKRDLSDAQYTQCVTDLQSLATSSCEQFLKIHSQKGFPSSAFLYPYTDFIESIEKVLSRYRKDLSVLSANQSKMSPLQVVNIYMEKNGKALESDKKQEESVQLQPTPSGFCCVVQ